MKAKSSFFQTLLKGHERLCKTCFWIAGTLLFTTAFTTTYDVCVRYFLNSPTNWSIDFVEYTLLYCTFLGAAWILKLDGHVKVTLIYDKLPPKIKLALDVFNMGVGALACGILTWQGAVEAWDAYVNHILIIRPITVPKWTIMWVIPFGLFLFCTYFVRNFFILWSDWRSGRTESRQEDTDAMV